MMTMLKNAAAIACGLIMSAAIPLIAHAGVTTVNGWYEGEEIYYIDLGLEEGVAERDDNQIYLIGGNRLWQAQVVLFIPGEAGYTPHWNVNVVNTADGITVDDILASPYASDLFPDALFDDVEDILGAQNAGLVTITTPGLVVLCPIISRKGRKRRGTINYRKTFHARGPTPSDRAPRLRAGLFFSWLPVSRPIGRTLRVTHSAGAKRHDLMPR
jgi:hypothetical protein